MEAQIGTGVGTLKTNVIINDQLGEAEISLHRLNGLLAGGDGVITQGADVPFRVDDRAIIWRQLSLGYLSHKRRLLIGFDQSTRLLSSERFFKFYAPGCQNAA